MNPDSPIDPRAALEASLTALLLGELPHAEAAALHQKLAQDPELAALYERLKHTIALVRETVSSPAEEKVAQAAPLRLSDQRRQKLLQQFKTVAPKEFVPPPRRRTRLIEVALAAAVVLLLASIAVPNFVRARRTFQPRFQLMSSLSKEQSAAPARSGQSVRNELYTSEAEGRDRPSAPPPPPPQTAPPPSPSASSAIVLPQAGEVADATTPPPNIAVGQGFAYTKNASGNSSAQVRSFQLGDADEGRLGGSVGGGTPAATAAPERRPTEVANASSFYEQLEAVDALKPGKVANNDGHVDALGEASTLSTTSGRSSSTLHFDISKDLGAANSLAAQADHNKQASVAKYAYGLESSTISSPVVPTTPAEVPPPVVAPAQQEPLFSLAITPSAPVPAAVAAQAQRHGPSSELPQGGLPSTALAANGLTRDDAGALRFLKHQQLSDAGVSQGKAKPSNPQQTSPAAGFAMVNSGVMVTTNYVAPTSAQWNLFDMENASAAPSLPAKEKNKSLELAWGEDYDRQNGKASGKADGRSEAGRNVHSLEVVGYITNASATAPTKLDRRARSPIALPPADAGVKFAFNDGNGRDEKPLGKVAAASEPSKQVLSDVSKGRGEPDVAKKLPAAAAALVPQPEVQTAGNPFSTFSLNVSDVSFKLAAASLEKGVMPEPATVRSEEFLNAFDYRDPEPPPGVPVAFAWERAQDPFAQGRDLLRFSIKTAALGRAPGRPMNIVLLLDNSGSMERADRVQIIREALRVLAAQLQPQDKFSIVTFARTARLQVDGVPGSQAPQAAEEVSGLTPQGGTNLEDAMNLGYQTALRHYLANGVNRVVLLTDGAANLGNVDPEALKQKVEANRKQGIALDCFGIGWEGYNDDTLEVLSRNGDGRYGFINTPEEAATEFAGQLAGALHVAASDAKVQVEFNPARVTAYRQIGYAKHQLTKEQFRDNTVNAAQIGAAESGNALYVIAVNPAGEGPLATVRARYRIPGTSDYHEHEWAVPYTGNAAALEQASPAMRLAATASAFSEWLVSSPYAGEVTPDRLLGYLSGLPEVYGADPRPKKLEWMIRQAKSIAGK
jgi:uncharacterized protein YegL